MIKHLSIAISAVFFVVVLGSFERSASPNPLQRATLKTIIVDAGHGGHEPGTNGDYSTEKAVCLDIALKLGKKLEQGLPDVRILYTRTTDTYPTNPWRADFANKNKGDLFVSIHANAMPPIKHTKFIGYRKETYYTGKGKARKKKTRTVPKYSVYYTPNTRSGTETYIWAADRADEKGEFVAETVQDSAEFVPDINDPEFKAKSLLWTKKHFDKSLLLASMVEEEFTGSGRTSLGVKQRNWKGIWVLQATGMPSILVETGFMTNREEEDYLNSEKGQETIAENVFTAIKRYKATLEGKQQPNSGIQKEKKDLLPKAVMTSIKNK
ncbi:MAG: N-acetylmuramoyl-L-alanine amidase [Chitinophagaceae bacterium]|nr:N-acetylmuramoyl-L-alanine amidase [Chitinophagaceae bacterium]